MPAIARVGDSHICPRKGHGRGVIVSGGSAIVEGSLVARMGDRVSCGCVIVQGAAHALDDGKPIAYVGCRTSGGGQITSGASQSEV